MTKFKPGVSFSDFVVHDLAIKRSRLREKDNRDYRRGWLVWLGIMLLLVLLLVRLAVLQVFEGKKYAILADENRIKTIKLLAPRGEIVDRSGELLAGNIKTVRDIGGVKVDEFTRAYPAGPALGHALGYISEVTADEVGLLKEAGQKYDAGDWIGRSGLEYQYENLLRGIDGGQLIEVDNAGNVVRDLGEKTPVPGQKIGTTLDKKISQVAYEGLMAGKVKKGAAIVSVPKTGEVLALVSAPSFDPKWFVAASESAKEIGEALTSRDLPLFNRAIGGAYPPGSTFKMVTSIAAIESEKVKPDFVFTDAGVMMVGEYKYSNWLFTKRGGVEGVVGFKHALTRSVDTFFYKVGELTGPEIVHDWATKFGLGVKTGVDIPGEISGIVTSPQYKEKMTGERWFLGNTYHMAIGQGDTLATPIGVHEMVSTLAADGRKCKLHMLAGKPIMCDVLPIKPATLDLVKDGMVGACSEGGTAFPLFDWNTAARDKQAVGTMTKRLSGQPLPVIACKTGTAEYIGDNGKMRTHAWLVAYAPVDDPQIAVTVLVEGGGEGSNAAAPIVRKVMASFFGVEDKYPYDRIPQELGE